MVKKNLTQNGQYITKMLVCLINKQLKRCILFSKKQRQRLKRKSCNSINLLITDRKYFINRYKRIFFFSNRSINDQNCEWYLWWIYLYYLNFECFLLLIYQWSIDSVFNYYVEQLNCSFNIRFLIKILSLFVDDWFYIQSLRLISCWWYGWFLIVWWWNCGHTCKETF